MKKANFIPKRNEIYMVDLPITSKSVQYGRRPVLVIQNDAGNTYSPTTIVVPLTSQEKRICRLMCILVNAMDFLLILLFCVNR